MDVSYRYVSMFSSFDKKLTTHLRRNVAAAARHTVKLVRDNIDTPGYNQVPTPPGVVAVGRRARTINHRHSKPGDYPFEQTGDLYRSIAWRMQLAAGIAARVGSNSPYVLALELGRPEINLRPRPFLFRTVRTHADAIARIMLTPL